jgi:hypothetical protein
MFRFVDRRVYCAPENRLRKQSANLDHLIVIVKPGADAGLTGLLHDGDETGRTDLQGFLIVRRITVLYLEKEPLAIRKGRSDSTILVAEGRTIARACLTL